MHICVTQSQWINSSPLVMPYDIKDLVNIGSGNGLFPDGPLKLYIKITHFKVPPHLQAANELNDSLCMICIIYTETTQFREEVLPILWVTQYRETPSVTTVTSAEPSQVHTGHYHGNINYWTKGTAVTPSCTNCKVQGHSQWTWEFCQMWHNVNIVGMA